MLKTKSNCIKDGSPIEPIISRELFEKVQVRLKTALEARNIVGWEENERAFYNVFYCGDCKRKMCTGRSKGYVYYYCNAVQYRDERKCSYKSISEDKQRTIFEEIEKLISNNVWMNYFWKLYTERKTLGMDGWIDFECEISRIIQTLDQARMTILADIRQGKKTGKMTQYQLNILSPLWGKAGIDRELISFEEKAITYRKTQFLKDLNRLTRCLEIYLGEFVEEIKPQVKLPDIEGLDINCVLSFNYTHTYENFYHTDKSKDVKYDYIHGEVKKDSTIETCNLILGVIRQIRRCLLRQIKTGLTEHLTMV